MLVIDKTKKGKEEEIQKVNGCFAQLEEWFFYRRRNPPPSLEGKTAELDDMHTQLWTLYAEWMKLTGQKREKK